MMSELLLGLSLGVLAILFLIYQQRNSTKKQAVRFTSLASERSNFENLLAEAQKREAALSVILESMTEGVIAVNRGKKVVLLNSGAERIFGVSKKMFLNRNLIEIVRNTRIDEMVSQAIQNRSRLAGEISIAFPKTQVLSANAIGISMDQQDISGILIVRDVTDIKRLEHVRQDFVANVSHELKTPLTSIKGFIETLLEGALRDRERSESFLKMMDEDASRLERLINDLLELSQIESREITLKLEAVDIGLEIEKIVLGFQNQIKKKRLTVHNHIMKTAIPQIKADRDKMKQIFINLIDNAIKFNRDDGSLSIKAQKLNGSLIEISIEDTGIGISKNNIPRIFERFYRVDKARSRELGGTGLGLSIAKHLAEVHGGKISCESNFGKSSQFTVVLPIFKT